MPAKDALRMPAKIFARPSAAKYLSASPFEDEFQAPPPAFANAADALRAKIRACAARSFAAQQNAAVRPAGAKDDGKGKQGAGLAAGRSARGITPEGLRAHS